MSSVIVSIAGLTTCRGLLLLWFVGLAPAVYSAPPRLAKLHIRLETYLTSYDSHRGTPFRAVVTRPLAENREVLIPERSTVYGSVRRAVRVRLGLIHERAALELNFFRYKTPDGQEFPLQARLVTIDNAREQVTKRGKIQGILAAHTPDEVLDGLWEKPSLNLFSRSLEGVTGVGGELLEEVPMGPAGPAVLLGLRCLLFRFPEPEIRLPPGTDMTLLVNEASTEFAPESDPPAPALPTLLADWLQVQPVRITKPDGRPVEDAINLAFIGSRNDLMDAFETAGWSRPDPTTAETISRFCFAFNSKKRYARAPVSTLLYQGRAPSLVFEKSLDSVSKRDHVRIWSAGFFHGKQIWLGAATHDIGVRFDRRTFLFTHRVSRHIDEERAKVAADLQFAGCSKHAMYSQESGVDTPRELKPAPRAAITDGRIAVLPLQVCNPPEEVEAEAVPRLPGDKATRLIRRIILESRNYVLRENVYYWAYEIVRYREREARSE